MVINIEQRFGKLIVSYINKEGNVSFMQLTVPPEHQYAYAYTRYRNEALPNVTSWDFKPVKKIPTQFLSKYRLQEFFMDAGEPIVAPLFEMNFPKLFSCDIEVEVTDEGFAEPGEATNRINTIAWCNHPDVYVFGLKPLTSEQCNSIEKEINNHLVKLDKKYSFVYKQYDNEATMISDFLYNYARLAPLITGWNFWNYDWRYIFNRCKKLNIDISWMSPTKKWYVHRVKDRNQNVEINLPSHKLIVDYLEIYKKWDRTIDPKENNTLDFVAEVALGIKKVKYTSTFKDLYEKDYDRYVFYNAIDSILVEQIHNKLKTMQTFLGLGNITRVESMQAFSPIQMLEAALARYTYKRNAVFPQTKQNNERESYEGAFVFDPIPNLYEWVVSLDYASLYPTLIRQFKISIENFVAKDRNYKINNNQIKCASGAVFDKTVEPYLSEILTDYFMQRKTAKKNSLKAEKEMSELEKILKERKSKVTLSL
jgi:DNA polymerase elongation subunit (family B)